LKGVVPTELDVCVSITNEGKETFTQKTEWKEPRLRRGHHQAQP